MRCSTSLLALAALTVGQAAASVLSHRHFHRRNNAAIDERSELLTSDLSKRSALSADDSSLLTTLGFKAAGVNAVSPNGAAWIGNDGPYLNKFHNSASEPVILTIWTGATSWVNANAPSITVSIPPGSAQIISFAEGVSGGFSGVYPSTKLVNGQVQNTWGEFTYSGSYSTVDVSREVTMEGQGLRIETENCLTDMDTCVFVCKGGLLTCWLDYELQNCEPGSQPGANYGISYGMPSGGCTGDLTKVSTWFL